MSVLGQIPSIPAVTLCHLMNVVEDVAKVYAEQGYEAALKKSESYPDMDSRVMATKAMLAASYGWEAGAKHVLDRMRGGEDEVERLRRLA